MKAKSIIFYRENRLNQPFTLTLEELAEQFMKSEYFKKYWQGHYFNLYVALQVFIGNSDGLNSTNDPQDLAENGENFLLLNDLINQYQTVG